MSTVCRSNYEHVKEHGFILDSELWGKNIQLSPKVFRTAEEAAAKAESSQPYDYILVTTKVLPAANLSAVIAPAVTPNHTTIVLIQNGIAIEQEYATRFPSNLLLSCVAYFPATQISPGHVEMGNVELLEIGSFPSSAAPPPSADRLISLLRSAGGNPVWHADIQPQRWKKLFFNAPWNPICALTLSRDVAFLAASPDDIAQGVVRGVMREVILVAEKLGYGAAVSAAAADEQLKRATERIGTKGIEPSMLADVLWRRRMEVEVILGNPVRVARGLGLDVPRLEMLYAMTKALDESIAHRKEGESLSGLDIPAAR